MTTSGLICFSHLHSWYSDRAEWLQAVYSGDERGSVLMLVLEVAWEWDYGSWKEWFDGMDVEAALVQG